MAPYLTRDWVLYAYVHSSRSGSLAHLGQSDHPGVAFSGQLASGLE